MSGVRFEILKEIQSFCLFIFGGVRFLNREFSWSKFDLLVTCEETIFDFSCFSPIDYFFFLLDLELIVLLAVRIFVD